MWEGFGVTVFCRTSQLSQGSARFFPPLSYLKRLCVPGSVSGFSSLFHLSAGIPVATPSCLTARVLGRWWVSGRQVPARAPLPLRIYWLSFLEIYFLSIVLSASKLPSLDGDSLFQVKPLFLSAPSLPAGNVLVPVGWLLARRSLVYTGPYPGPSRYCTESVFFHHILP